MKEDVNEQKLRKTKLKYEKHKKYFKIRLKAFIDSGADESLLSGRLSKCLVMKDSQVRISTILGEQEGKKLMKCSGFIEGKGKLQFYQMGDIQKTPLLRFTGTF